MRILVLTNQTPAYPGKGDVSRLFSLLEPLAKRHEVRVLSTGGEPRFGSLPRGIDVRLIPAPATAARRSDRRIRRNLAHYVSNTRPYRLLDWEHHQRALTGALATHVAEFTPDVVHIEHAQLGTLLPSVPSHVARVLVEINMLVSMQRQLLRTSSPLRLAREVWEMNLVARYERRVLGLADRVVVVTEHDRRVAQRLCSGVRVSVVPNCVVADYWLRQNADPSEHPSIVLTGGFAYPPNREAAYLLVHHVLPRVRRVVPDAQLFIVGHDAPQWLAEIATRTPGLHVTGLVDDVRPILHSAWVAVAPLRTGSGSPLKVIEALASRVPVVTLPRIAAALDLAEGEGVLLARRSSGVAAAIVRLIRDPTLRARVAVAGERIARQRFDREAASLLLESAWEKAVAYRRSLPASAPGSSVHTS